MSFLHENLEDITKCVVTNVEISGNAMHFDKALKAAAMTFCQFNIDTL